MNTTQGHEKRTNRHNKKESYADHKFGSKTYAKEELVAEIGAMILTGNRITDNSIAYIQNWIQKLKESGHKKDIYEAWQLAQTAKDFIQGKD